jgi:hypothetical protein
MAAKRTDLALIMVGSFRDSIPLTLAKKCSVEMAKTLSTELNFSSRQVVNF